MRCCGALLAVHLEGAVREGEACAVGALDAAAERACEEAGVVLGREREQDAAALELQLRRLDAPPRHLHGGRGVGGVRLSSVRRHGACGGKVHPGRLRCTGGGAGRRGAVLFCGLYPLSAAV